MTHHVVFVRHGQSQWNLENRFTGWVDIDLADAGRAEAHEAGRQLREAGFEFDVAFTSVLKRAIHTLWIILDELDQAWIPVERSWRLNERHYGALAGLDKVETAEKHGDEQVFIWRRSYDIPPPPLDQDDPQHPRFDRRYNTVGLPEATPGSEALKQTLERAVPYWNDHIVPRIRAGERVLIAAHGNSIRALVKHLDQIPDDEIAELNIPTGMPLIYDFDDNLHVLTHHYLGGDEAAAAAAAAVAAQATRH
jgi:2,3-bisphosphoglycerate-dependent phosphoglycerate mutase